MTNLIIIASVALLMILALGYLRREKKRGRRCVGCPHAGSCGGGCAGK